MSYDENRISDQIDGGLAKKKFLEDNLIVGARIKIGPKYAEMFGFESGEVIELINGHFEYDNGLYTEDQQCPAVYDESLNDYDSIFHLFGNDFEHWLDNEILTRNI